MRLTRDDRGFTLVELLVTIVILGVVAVPLGNAIIGWLHNSEATTDRLALSHDAQISAAYFAQDVASVGLRESAYPYPSKQSIERNVPADGGLYPCGGASTPQAVIRFAWTDPTGASTTQIVRVAYYLRPAGVVSELRRIKCNGSATESDVPLAHYVDPATVNPTCSSSCEDATVPQKVTLSFSVTKPSVGPYQISLTGQRRQT
jgi:prepilin-type N-terminal cleavage/methylation domain-containing protein